MKKSKKIYTMRHDYIFPALNQSQLTDNPADQFAKWFDDAGKSVKRNFLAKFLVKVLGINDIHSSDINAMTLSTTNADSQPSARIVLLKEFSNDGLVFFGNYQSRKFKELEENSKVALLFFWQNHMRQVRVEGVCQKLTAAENQEYFASRPYESQIGAWASPQSSKIKNREYLERIVDKYKKQFPKNSSVPCPTFWGGYRLIHQRVEFWQGREDRLHDRFVYEKKDNGQWDIYRLAP